MQPGVDIFTYRAAGYAASVGQRLTWTANNLELSVLRRPVWGPLVRSRPGSSFEVAVAPIRNPMLTSRLYDSDDQHQQQELWDYAQRAKRLLRPSPVKIAGN